MPFLCFHRLIHTRISTFFLILSGAQSGILVQGDTGLDYVEFFASPQAEDLRIWRMAAHVLVILFEIVESSESRATPHSIRSASSGSIAEARRAGK
jgi:hypothetical protein